MAGSHFKPKALSKEPKKRTTSFKKSRSGNSSAHSQDAESPHGRDIVNRQASLIPIDRDFGAGELLEDTSRSDVGIDDNVDNQDSPSSELQIFESDEEYLSSFESQFTVEGNVLASNVSQPIVSHSRYANNPQTFSYRDQVTHCAINPSSACPRDQRSFSYNYRGNDCELTAPAYPQDGFQSYTWTDTKTEHDSSADRNDQAQLARWAYETSDSNLTMTEQLEKSNWEGENFQRL